MKNRLFRIFFPAFQAALVIAQGWLVNKLSDKFEQEFPLYLVLCLALISGILISLLDASSKPVNINRKRAVVSHKLISLWLTPRLLILFIFGISIILLALVRFLGLSSFSGFSLIFIRGIPIFSFFIFILAPPIILFWIQIDQYRKINQDDKKKSKSDLNELPLFRGIIDFISLISGWMKSELYPSIIKNKGQVTLSIIGVIFVVYLNLQISPYLDQRALEKSLTDSCLGVPEIPSYISMREDYKVNSIEKIYGTIVEQKCAEMISNSSVKSELYLYYFQRGNARYISGDLEGAIEDYSQTIKIKPDFFEAYNSRGIVRLIGDDVKGAIEDYSQANSIANSITFGQNPDVKYSFGKIHSKLGDFKTATKIYTAVIESLPEDSYFRQMVFNDRGDALYELGQYKLAIEDFHKSIGLDVDYLDYNYFLDYNDFNNRDYSIILKIIESYLRMGEYEEAFKGYSLVIGHFGCRNVEQEVEKMRNTIKAFDTSSDLVSNNEMKFTYYLNNNPERTQYLCSESHYGRGEIRKEEWDHYGGIGDYTRAIQLRPDFAEAYHQRGNIYLRIDQKGAAIHDYQKASDLFIEQGDKSSHKITIDLIRGLNSY